ncbi:ABC transporter permease [Streptomyces sp. NBC_00237]|uniref:ABC transporter permease n=1 Tax=Streptomyces sp. NBC_00237 TaxID=2975687 RepID=UPI00224D86B3|nr:ABC transporter permease [Streptomyces sp. NBC_00237]MCX5204090.1 ABC transporter permease [Streptomyces sp. NBC_00237]
MSASTAVLRTEARLYRREPGVLFWVLLFPTVLMVIIGLVPDFQKPSAELGGLRTIDVYVPVAVLLALIMAGLQALPPTLSGYRERGILRRMSTTPVRPATLLGAQIAVNAVAAIGSGLLAMTVGRIAFDVALPQQLVGYVLALVVAALAALALGGVVCAVSRTTKIAQAVGSVVFFPAMFTAGVWLPVQQMPETLRTIVEFTPLGAASQALNDAMIGSWPGWDHLGVLVAWTVVLIAAASRWFTWE